MLSLLYNRTDKKVKLILLVIRINYFYMAYQLLNKELLFLWYVHVLVYHNLLHIFLKNNLKIYHKLKLLLIYKSDQENSLKLVMIKFSNWSEDWHNSWLNDLINIYLTSKWRSNKDFVYLERQLIQVSFSIILFS